LVEGSVHHGGHRGHREGKEQEAFVFFFSVSSVFSVV
jgi:hypothetical protein